MALLHKPTVGQLVTALSHYPQDKEVVIEDADTGWLIETIHIDHEEKIVIWGDYTEMKKPELENFK